MVLFILVVFACFFLSFHSTGITGANIYLSKDDDLKIERQLKLLNKPAVKTIKTEHGDIYDCVDFFKQPAFDHPLLKNYTTDFQVLPPSVLNTLRSWRSKKVYKIDNVVLKGLDCPVGTVPIRRVTKEDYIRETIVSEASATENGQTEYAVVMTIGANRYSGAGASLSIHNPPVTGTQSSASRIRIENGLDSIQAGWRVDKLLHGGSNQTRLFIHTKAGGIKCFNTLCPGFVLLRPDFPLGSILLPISKPGGPVHAVSIYIIRDEHGNWIFSIANGHILIGYWPARLFTGLSGLASVLEWGGETYSPAGTPFPPMGAGVSGHSRLAQDTRYDAFFCNVSSFNVGGKRTDAENLVPVMSDTGKYQLRDQGVVDKDNFKHLVFYGGGGGKGNF